MWHDESSAYSLSHLLKPMSLEHFWASSLIRVSVTLWVMEKTLTGGVYYHRRLSEAEGVAIEHSKRHSRYPRGYLISSASTVF